MKTKILTAVLFLCFARAFSQATFPLNTDGKVCFSEVVNTTNQLQDAQLYQNFKEWFSTELSKFQRSNSEKSKQGMEYFQTSRTNFALVDNLYQNDQPLKIADQEILKIIGKVVYKYTGGTMGCIRVMYFEYDIIIKMKDGKYKYDITDFTYTHYDQTNAKQVQINTLKDEGPCRSKGNLESLLTCEKCKGEFEKMYANLIDDINNLVEKMKTDIDKSPDDENW